VLDSADTFDNMKPFFEAGTNGVVPVDMFYSWCGDRGNYVGSDYFKSWGVTAAHPEGFLIDRDGNVRKHYYGYSGTELAAMEDFIKELLGVA
jgi:hypothetical protein